ncbi:MAG: helix-turn-helix transcriptional regulator [Thermoplasmata archaeon]|nr:MAG: helix-turn-helix transcriptional regulator [Thermoplasmata archaeon]
MDKESIRRLLFVLGKEHCLDVLINVHKKDWQTASEVARDLNIHIATAVKYLTELHELGLVNRRVKRGKTREAFEYQVKNQNIRIEFELTQLMDRKPAPDNKPLVLFAILHTIFVKSRKVVGASVESFVNGRFERLKNGEKNIVMDSLLFEGDLEDANRFFLKSLNGITLTKKRCDDVVLALTELINSVIEHYEARLGSHSTESLIDVTMKKVITTLGGDVITDSSVLSTLPYDYFGKWRK